MSLIFLLFILLLMHYHTIFEDKIYEARHKLLNLHPKPTVVAEIPKTYFSNIEQDINTSALVEILSSVPNSPLTPGGMIQTFTSTFPNFQNQFCSRNYGLPNLTPANLRYHALQQQVLQISNQNCLPNLINNVTQPYLNISPRSSNSNTSGYLSQSSHIGSLNISGSSNSVEHLYPPYEPLLQVNGNKRSNFSQTEKQLLVGTSANISRHLIDTESNTFEQDSNSITPNLHPTTMVCYYYNIRIYCTHIYFSSIPNFRVERLTFNASVWTA